MTRQVTAVDVEVGLAELVKAVRTAKARAGKEPLQTTEESEAASKKAARFAAQVRALGAQRAADGDEAGAAFARKMAAHADAIQAANRELIAANNEYIMSPSDKVAQRRHDAACDSLIAAAEAAGGDAQRVPPGTMKRSAYGEFTIGGSVRLDGVEGVLLVLSCCCLVAECLEVVLRQILFAESSF